MRLNSPRVSSFGVSGLSCSGFALSGLTVGFLRAMTFALLRHFAEQYFCGLPPPCVGRNSEPQILHFIMPPFRFHSPTGSIQRPRGGIGPLTGEATAAGWG